MNYVFFDVECANCLNGEGKICSFGFVKTDENFQVIKKKDILVNPNAKFLLGNVKTGEGIKLAYPLFKFQRADTFPRFYSEIRTLLEDENTICFGFAVHQDVSYLSYSCRRYGLPVIKFRFFDIQKMEQRIYQRKNPSGLDHLIEQFSLNSFTYHRSDDDALMSMEVFQQLLKEKKMTVSDALAMYPECFNDTEHFLKVAEERKLQREKKKEVGRKISFFMESKSIQPDLNHFDKFFWKKKFCFHSAVLSEYIDEMNKNKELFYKKGGKTTSNIIDSDYVVLVDGKDMEQLNIDAENRKRIKFITYYTFKKHLKE